VLSALLMSTPCAVMSTPLISMSSTQQPVTTVRTTTTVTTWTTITDYSGCGDVARCLDDAQCARCLLAINTTPAFFHTRRDFSEGWSDVVPTRAYEEGFFQALQSTASCSTNATPEGVLYTALQELSVVPTCTDAYGMVVSTCLVPEYVCYLDPSCRQCLAALHAAINNGNEDSDGDKGAPKADAFRSRACTDTNPALLNDLVGNCLLPRCTFAKQQCASSGECAACMTTLDSSDGGGGGGAQSARQCPQSQSSGLAVDTVVFYCSHNTEAACGFWRQRCADNVNCGACLASMGNGDNARAIAADWSKPDCQRALRDGLALTYIGVVTTGCPGISTCRTVVTNCISNPSYSDLCIACINGSAPPSQAALCDDLSLRFSFDAACRPCPASVHTINLVVLATATVGGASAAACLAVVITIAAHGREKLSMRDRIVVGLMMANAVYSTANAIPLNALRTNVLDCGRHTMSFDAIRFGRAWWFCGKYGLVGFELFILGASIRAMLRGTSAVPRCAEAAMHVACCAVAAVAFSMFYVMCASINADGYNVVIETEEYTNEYSHASANDDLDDVTPSETASAMFTSERDAYDELVREMLVAWDGLVVLAVGLWIVLRMLYRHALRVLRTEEAAVALAETSDVWADTRRGAWDARRRFLNARSDAFTEVAKPLEPYIVVFVLFAGPAFVMSTTFCQRHSGATSAVSTGRSVAGLTTEMTYGTCDVWCEFVLAFRSLGTVAVYLMPRQRRVELVAVCATWRKLCSRVIGCLRCTPVPHASSAHDSNDEQEMRALVPNEHPNNSADANADEGRESWRINECDITTVRRLGQGGFGTVWEGLLEPGAQRVAVKIMFLGAVDEDGDVVDPKADEDFHKECAALRRVDSPHLLKFFGFGTTDGGKGFIVTELMSGGSLEDVLHDNKRELPWHARVKIGLQVALGMEHLHKRHMLHRDLKSANVLLDEDLKAKVCDFGLSRVVRPARRHVVHSPFTGVTRLLPHVSNGEINESHLSMANVGVSILDARGTMTKAAGTLLWMAPEVFRGDQNYTSAVDVYSFGMVLWEMAARKTPWAGELPSEQAGFFEALNRALQRGQRPAISDDVMAEHGAFVAVMQQCWAGDPVDRPTFSEVSTQLAACVQGVE
jgi:hypothetical protein